MKAALSFLLLLASCYAYAQTIVEETSFGHGGARPAGMADIHGWKMLGEGQDLQLLSDKVILTPPYPGNKRGALWAEHTTALRAWTADFEFRVNGPERAGGNLQLWYANNGQQTVGTSSIYTVGKFDGLAIVIDSHGGGAGSIRGFLNDGSTDYQSRHPAVDSLAFGHCEYGYRNLGRPSRLTLKHSPDNFEVLVDGRQCFSSNKITLPPNYNWGISAATSEYPDSFEVFKFVVTSGATSSSPPPPQPPQGQGQGQAQQQQQQALLNSNPPGTEGQTDAPASVYTTSEAQFADLHNRIQAMNNNLNTLFHEFVDFKVKSEQRHEEVLRQCPREATMNNLDHRLEGVEKMLAEMKREIKETDHAGQFKLMQDRLAKAELGITSHLPAAFTEAVTSSAPRMGFFLTVVVLVQLGLAIAYVVYKRRRANSPKKFL